MEGVFCPAPSRGGKTNPEPGVTPPSTSKPSPSRGLFRGASPGPGPIPSRRRAGTGGGSTGLAKAPEHPLCVEHCDLEVTFHSIVFFQQRPAWLLSHPRRRRDEGQAQRLGMSTRKPASSGDKLLHQGQACRAPGSLEPSCRACLSLRPAI